MQTSKRKVVRIGVLNTALIFGAMYFVISLVILVPIFYIMSSVADMAGEMGGASSDFAMFSGGMLIALPFIYGIMGFIGSAILCALFNLVAPRVGGVEVDVATVEDAETDHTNLTRPVSEAD